MEAKNYLKKIATIAILVIAYNANAQVLESDNFDSYVLGNLGTDTTGNIPGQGGNYTVRGVNEDYQIVNIDAEHGKSLQISSVALQASSSNRVVYKDGFGDAWLNRTPGNNIIKTSFQIYTGSSEGGKRIGSQVYAIDTGIAAVYYNSLTKKIECYASIQTGGTSGSLWELVDLYNNVLLRIPGFPLVMPTIQQEASPSLLTAKLKQ